MQKEIDHTTQFEAYKKVYSHENLRPATKLMLLNLEEKPPGFIVNSYSIAKELKLCRSTVLKCLQEAVAYGYAQKIVWFENGLKRERYVTSITPKFTQTSFSKKGVENV